MADAQIGEHYRKVDGGSIWEAVAIHVDQNGIRHCRIVNVGDHTNTKVVSESTLMKRRFFRRYAEAQRRYEEVE